MRGERADFIDNFVRGERYSLLAAITTNGYVACRAVLGSFDSVEFFDFVAEQVVRPNPTAFKSLVTVVAFR